MQSDLKSSFYIFHIDFRQSFLFSILTNCVRHESWAGKLAPISPKSPKFVAQTDLCVHR